MKIEHEKMNIEKEKVVLETKVKHIGEQSKILCYTIIISVVFEVHNILHHRAVY